MNPSVARLRPLLAIGVLAGGLTACADVMSAMNIFLVKFFYGGVSISSIELPGGFQSAVDGYSLFSGRGQNTASYDQFTNKNNYKVHLNLGVGTDNSGNSDSAAFPLATGLSMFVQKKGDNRISASLPAFGVGGRKVDTQFVDIPIPLSAVSNETFKAILKGDKIPYWLTGSVGFQLKSPTGDVLSSQTSEVDIATDAIETRPNGSEVKAFMSMLSTLVN